MTTTILIARHGNTFGPGDTLCRVGSGTDLPLVESGLKQGSNLGLFLREQNIRLDHVFTSPLQRTQQTAQNALKIMGQDLPLNIDDRFNEIDYGPDEGQPEDAVISRLGKTALETWDRDAIVPVGWEVDPNQMIKNWQSFSDEIISQHKDQTLLVVTSNGTARFAPYLTNDFDGFKQQHKIKLSTGAICALTYQDDAQNWNINYWNVKPIDWLEDHNIEAF